MNGFLLIDKEQNMTSFDVIRKINKLDSSLKPGHTGTLDPDTTGILVIAVGLATKFVPILSAGSQKEYIATMHFGQETDTLDHTGEVINIDVDFKFEEEKIKNVVNTFIGSYMQTPPQLSAKKVNGKRAYENFHQGKTTELKPVKVTIDAIEIINIDPVARSMTFKALVSKGTYIRSLINDIAQKLGTYAYMSELRRIKTDGFTINDAYTLSEIEKDQGISRKILDLKAFLTDNITMHIKCTDKLLHLVKNGVQIKNPYFVKWLEKQQNEHKEKKVNKSENQQKFSELILMIDEKENLLAIYEKKIIEDAIFFKQVINIWSINDL